jgi:hypothetical protein
MLRRFAAFFVEKTNLASMGAPQQPDSRVLSWRLPAGMSVLASRKKNSTATLQPATDAACICLLALRLSSLNYAAMLCDIRACLEWFDPKQSR